MKTKMVSALCYLRYHLLTKGLEDEDEEDDMEDEYAYEDDFPSKLFPPVPVSYYEPRAERG